MNEHHIVAIVDDERLLTRYPEAVGAGPERMIVRAGGAADLLKPGATGGIIDDTRLGEILPALHSKKPVVLGPESLATLAQEEPEFTATLLERDWIPFLPVSLNAEVISATEILNSGTLETIRSCHLTTYVGPVSAETWKQDAPFARSFFEAIVLGLDLLTNLFDAPVNSTRWLTIDTSASFGVAVHEFGAGILAVQEIAPSRLAASPLFTATVYCEGGKVLLRDEFAPSGMTVWYASSRSFRCPALAREKPNVQAPDTVQGGLETATLIGALNSGERDGLPTQEHALKIVRHAIASDATDALKNELREGTGTRR
jgi:hypothetical protein